jgi:uncharacterized protein (DUF58 family)
LAETGISHYLSAEAMHKLSRQVLLSRYVVEGNLAGAHRSPLKGASSEFADHKLYNKGDDPKHIDWKVFARTDKFFIKRYEDETNLRVYFVIDCSNSMNYRSDDELPTKYEYACRLATMMGFCVVKMRDSVGLFMVSDKIKMQMVANNSLNHLNNICKRMQNLEPDANTNLAESLHLIADSIHKRALVVVISDLFGDDVDPEPINLALAHFRKNMHDVIVFHTLDPAEMDLSFKKGAEFMDMETKEVITANPKSLAESYQDVFEQFLSMHRKACKAMKIDYRIVRTDEALDDFARAYLEERKRLNAG